MVVFIDLDDELEPPELRDLNAVVAPHWSQPGYDRVLLKSYAPESALETLSVRDNPNRNALTEALGCYP